MSDLKCFTCKSQRTCTMAPRCSYQGCASHEEQITQAQAREFYRDLCGTVYGNANKTSQGIMPVTLIAKHMNITLAKAAEFCDAMIMYGITERQNGMVVI